MPATDFLLIQIEGYFFVFFRGVILVAIGLLSWFYLSVRLFDPPTKSIFCLHVFLGKNSVKIIYEFYIPSYTLTCNTKPFILAMISSFWSRRGVRGRVKRPLTGLNSRLMFMTSPMEATNHTPTLIFRKKILSGPLY